MYLFMTVPCAILRAFFYVWTMTRVVRNTPATTASLDNSNYPWKYTRLACATWNKVGNNTRQLIFYSRTLNHLNLPREPLSPFFFQFVKSISLYYLACNKSFSLSDNVETLLSTFIYSCAPFFKWQSNRIRMYDNFELKHNYVHCVTFSECSIVRKLKKCELRVCVCVYRASF